MMLLLDEVSVSQLNLDEVRMIMDFLDGISALIRNNHRVSKYSDTHTPYLTYLITFSHEDAAGIYHLPGRKGTFTSNLSD